MTNALKAFEDFLNTGWGKGATKFLKDGAVLQVSIDEVPFFLAKKGERLGQTPGIPERFGILVEISSAAIDYLAGSKTEDEAHDRLKQVIHRPGDGKYARMRIQNVPTEEGRIDFYWQGFYFWARRLEFLF